MRLIDADAYLYKGDLINEPTIDAEPVKHGHLCSTDAYPHRLYCSECYKTLIPNEEICFEKNEFPKYCMWCGAKMDEGENETSAKLIKPCPICGGKAEQGYKPNYGYIVYCPNCGIGTGYKDIEEQAIEAWNRRICDDTKRSD